MTKKQKRFALVIVIVAIAGGALALTLSALKGTITYFYTPGDVVAMASPPDRPIRLGGLVENESVKYSTDPDGTALVSFSVTDGEASIIVSYAGILPDLFREGQGVIVQGRVNPATHNMIADNVLAKHDENYMPKELVEALKEKGHWEYEGEQPSE